MGKGRDRRRRQRRERASVPKPEPQPLPYDRERALAKFRCMVGRAIELRFSPVGPVVRARNLADLAEEAQVETVVSPEESLH